MKIQVPKDGLVGGDWNHGTLNDFPETVGNVIIPTDEHSIIFQRGRYTTNQVGMGIDINFVGASYADGLKPMILYSGDKHEYSQKAYQLFKMGTGVFDPALIPPFGAMKYHLSVIK
jgi:hypothetical protein